METKVCPKCGEEKPLTGEYFYKTKRNNHESFSSYCKRCVLKQQKEYCQRDPEKQKIKRKKYYENNKVRITECNKIYCELHPDISRKAKQKYRIKAINSLNDTYIKELLKSSGYDNPSLSMIEMKRNEITMNRQLQLLKKQLLAGSDSFNFDNHGRDKGKRNAEYRLLNPLKEIQCPNCGKLFLQRIVIQSYCSRECKDKFIQIRRHNRKHPILKKLCVICNNEFETRRTYQKCCSTECSHKHNLERISSNYYKKKEETNYESDRRNVSGEQQEIKTNYDRGLQQRAV